MAGFEVRGYRCEDEEALLRAWASALPLDAIDHVTFCRKVLLDPNFDPEWLIVAEADGRVVGFSLCLVRRAPLEKVGLEPHRGWITAFGVVPDSRGQGVGSALLERSVELFAREGRTEVSIAPYTPNYFVPGVDEQAYADGLRFLTARGFEVVQRPLSMDANIVKLDESPYAGRAARLAEQGIEVRTLRPHEIPLLLGFLRDHMPGDWLRHGRALLDDASRGLARFEQFTIAVHAGEILGYCQCDGDHFGPFGVRDDAQGKGIGTVLLARCLSGMRRRGHHSAWVLWTSDDTASKVYSRFGFAETRRFSVLRRRLG